MKLKNLARVLACIGLVILGSSVVTWWIGRPDLALVKVGFALATFAFWAVTNFGDLGRHASSRTTFYYGVSAVTTAVLLLALVFGNYILVKNPKSWDLTKNQIHTLSPDTVKTLEGLKDDVTVTAFYTAGEQGFPVLNDLFKRYAARSERFKFEFVDAIKSPEKTKQLNPKPESRIFVRLGATEARVTELTEEALTNAIVKVTHSATKKVYFTTGHGEADPDDSQEAGLSEVKKRMENEGLKAEKLNLAGTAEIPADAQAVVVAGPAKPFVASEVETLRKFLDGGGKAFIMLEPLIDSGLEELLRSYNVEADRSQVVDPVSRLFGASDLIPVVQSYSATSEITRDFRLNTAFPTSRPLTVLHETGVVANVEPVALSMPSAWGETSVAETVERDDHEKGGPFPLVVSVTREVQAASSEAGGDDDADAARPRAGRQTRLVVAGDRDFATNKFRNAWGNEDFFLNGLNWLCEQSERITIRPRLRDASRLYLTPTQQATIFFFAIDIVPVTLLAAGLAVWLVRRSK